MASVSNSLVVTKGKLDAQGIGVYTGSCDTEGGTSSKVCTFDKEVAPLDGVQISITFSHANTAPNVSLRIGKSDFPVYAGSKPLTSTSVNCWADGQTVNFICSHEKWYMTSVSSADIMEFSSKDGEGSTLDIYNSKESGFKASLGNTSLAFKYKKDKDSEDKVIAQYGLDGVYLYSSADDKANIPYAKFGEATTLGYTNGPRLEAGSNFLAMYDNIPEGEKTTSEYFKVNRNALAFRTEKNKWFGISNAGKLGLLSDEDFSISESTMNGYNENLLKDTEESILFTSAEEDDNHNIKKAFLITDPKKIIKGEIYTLSFKASVNTKKSITLKIYYKDENEPIYSSEIPKEKNINFKQSFEIKNDNIGSIYFSLTENTSTKKVAANDGQAENKQPEVFLLKIEEKTLKLEKGDIQTDWCFPIDYPQTSSKALKESSQMLEKQLTVAQYLLGLNKQDPLDWSKYDGCWGVEKDGDSYSLVTNFLSANAIKAGTLKSLSYNEVEGDIFSKEGLCIDLSSGSIKSPALSLIQEKDEETQKITSLLSVKGNIEASSGKIGGFTINSDSLFSTRIEDNITTATVAISSGENFLLCKSNDQENNLQKVFSVTKDGSLFATKGTIGGLKISENSLSSPAEGSSVPGFQFNKDGTFSLGKDAIVYKNQKLSINSETVISSLATKNKAVEINNGNFPIQLTSNGNNLKMNSSGIIMSGTVNSNEELELIKLSTEKNIPNIIIGNSAKDNSHIKISSSQVDIETPGNGNMSLSGTNFSITTEETAGTPASFSLNDKFVYNSKIGFLLTSANGNQTLDKIIEDKRNQDISTYLGWITQNDTSDQKNVNLIATDKGLGFFSDGSPQTPIAYFTKDKLYVKRTQVLDRQQISSFIWQNREGSNYLRTGERNIGLKWLVNKKEG